MDILLDSRFLKISEIQDTKGGLQTLPTHSNVASVADHGRLIPLRTKNCWKGQNTDYVSAEKDKGPAFSGTVLIWEAS